VRSLISIAFIILILLGLFFFLKSFVSKGPDAGRRFKGPNFKGLRNELDRGELHRDPVSGTYVAEGDAVIVEKGGRKYYFASEENAERFRRGETGD